MFARAAFCRGTTLLLLPHRAGLIVMLRFRDTCCGLFTVLPPSALLPASWRVSTAAIRPDRNSRLMTHVLELKITYTIRDTQKSNAMHEF